MCPLPVQPAEGNQPQAAERRSVCSQGATMRLLDERIWLLFRRHLLQTLTYWSVFFSFGLCIAFLGPTILDLRCQTQSTLQQITWVFFSQQFFLLVGSSVGGLFKKTWEKYVLQSFSGGAWKFDPVKIVIVLSLLHRQLIVKRFFKHIFKLKISVNLKSWLSLIYDILVCRQNLFLKVFYSILKKLRACPEWLHGILAKANYILLLIKLRN